MFGPKLSCPQLVRYPPQTAHKIFGEVVLPAALPPNVASMFVLGHDNCGDALEVLKQEPVSAVNVAVLPAVHECV